MLYHLADKVGPTEIQTYADNRDYDSYNRLRGFISDPKGTFTPSPSQQPRTPQPNPMLPPVEPTYTLPNGHPRPQPPYPVAMPPRVFTAGLVPISFLLRRWTKCGIGLQPRFKDSPFYTVLEPLTPVVECKGMPPGVLIMC